jgi:hypothetical protein
VSWNETYLLADPSYIPTQADIDKVVGLLQGLGIVGQVTEGAAVLDGSVTWEAGPQADRATFAPAWEIKVWSSMEPEMYLDDSGLIAETHFAILFKEAADARDEFVQTIAQLLGTKISDGISHH